MSIANTALESDLMGKISALPESAKQEVAVLVDKLFAEISPPKKECRRFPYGLTGTV